MATGDVAITLRVNAQGQIVLEQAGQQLQRLQATSASTSRATREMGVTATEAASRFERLKATIGSYGRQILIASGITLGIAGAVGLMRSSLRAFEEQDRAMAKLKGTARVLGLDYKLVSEEVLAASSAMQKKTTFSDEAQIEALATLALFTKDYSLAMKHHNLLLDMAAGLNIDLVSTARYLALGLQGNTIMLARYIPQLRGLSDEEKNAANITRILQKTFGGMSQEMATTWSGRLAQYRNKWSEFKEWLGEKFIITAGGTISDIQAAGRSLKRFFVPEEGEKIKPKITTPLITQTEVDAILKRNVKEFQFTKDISTRLEILGTEGELTGRIKSLWEDIGEEMHKATPSVKDIDKGLREVIDTQRQIKKTWQEIAALEIERGRAPTKVAARLIDVLGRLEPEKLEPLQAFFGQRNILPGLTLGGALTKTEGISGFQRFQEAELAEGLRRPGLSTGERAKLSAELFETRLGIFGSATSDIARIGELPRVLEAMEVARGAEIARINEEIQERRRLVEKSVESAETLKQIRDRMDELIRTTREARKASENPVFEDF